MKKLGRPAGSGGDPFSRFLAKVEPDNSSWCLIWQSSHRHFFSGGKPRQESASHWIYKRMIGPLPWSARLLPICGNMRCVGPLHLEPYASRYEVKALERFNRCVTVTASGCFEWKTGKDLDGYGVFYYKGTSVRAHRWAYEHIALTPIPPELHLDHLCKNTSCVNPAHLEPVTPQENLRRGNHPSQVSSRLNVCVKGLHRLDGDNLLLNRGKFRTSRICKACRNLRIRNRIKNDAAFAERVKAYGRRYRAKKAGQNAS